MRQEHCLGVREKCTVTELQMREDPQSMKSPMSSVNVYYEQGNWFCCCSSFLGFLKLGEELGTFSENEVIRKCQGFTDPRLRIPVSGIFAMITSFLT